MIVSCTPRLLLVLSLTLGARTLRIDLNGARALC